MTMCDLSWNSFGEHSQDLLKQLLLTNTFADVTLVSDDKCIFKVHKFILNACSPVFQEIFKSDTDQKCIYLRGVYKRELEAILEFMYIGETKIKQDKVIDFIKVASDFEIKEVENIFDVYKTDQDLKKNIMKNEDTNEKKNVDCKQDVVDVSDDDDANRIETEPRENIEDKMQTAQEVDANEISFIKEISNSIEQNKEILDDSCSLKENSNSSKNCGKENNSPQRPVEKIFNEKGKLVCQICLSEFAGYSGLYYHVKAKHEAKYFPCNKCNYKATRETYLKAHKRKHKDDRKVGGFDKFIKKLLDSKPT